MFLRVTIINYFLSKQNSSVKKNMILSNFPVWERRGGEDKAFVIILHKDTLIVYESILTWKSAPITESVGDVIS